MVVEAVLEVMVRIVVITIINETNSTRVREQSKSDRFQQARDCWTGDDLWAFFPLSSISFFNDILVEKFGNSFPFAFHFLLPS